jgi:hypothetical protein
VVPKPYRLYEYNEMRDPLWVLHTSSNDLRIRVEEQLRIRRPPQPFMGEPDPVPASTTPLVEMSLGPGGFERPVINLSVRKQQRLAKEAAQADADNPDVREKRFRLFRKAETAA